MNFTNKNVLILGGGGDIGLTIVKSFKKAGAQVCCQTRKVGKYQADLSDSNELKKCMETVIANVGVIDIMVNSVSAAVKNESFEKKSWVDFKRHLEVQLKASVESIPYILPGMKENKWGRIVHILTTYTEGEIPTGLTDYVAAKYALLGLTKSLAKELGRYNITVNAVSPSFIKNNFTKQSPEKLVNMVLYNTPTKRLTTEEDVARAVLFLASEQADNITGVNIPVTGGSHL